MSSISAVDSAIDYILESAQAAKVDLEVLAMERKSTAIAFQQRKMDQFALSETRQLGVRWLDGAHEGVAYSESLDRGSLDQMLLEAQANARMIEKEWPSELTRGGRLPSLPDLFDPSLEEVPIKEKIKTAELLEASALDFDPSISGVAYTRYSDSTATVWVANSKGLRGSYKQNYCSGFNYCLAADGENKVMDGETDAQRRFGNLDAVKIGRVSAQKTLARRGARRPATGKYTVVVQNRAAESLVGLIAGYFSAKAVDENTSPLKGRLNQRVFSQHLSLTDDPFLVASAGCRPFDEEGYASQKTALIENGVVKAFLTNSMLARKLKLAHTASASRAPSTELGVGQTTLLVRPGSASVDQLLAAEGKVLLVTEINGFASFRATSGDFSLPMEGFLYENGRLSHPLKDFMISGNILELLAAVDGVGSDVLPPVSTVISPSLLIRGLNVIGES